LSLLSIRRFEVRRCGSWFLAAVSKAPAAGLTFVRAVLRWMRMWWLSHGTFGRSWMFLDVSCIASMDSLMSWPVGAFSIAIVSSTSVSALCLHSGGHLSIGALPARGGFPRAVRAVDPRLLLLPGGLGDPAASLRERQAAPRHR